MTSQGGEISSRTSGALLFHLDASLPPLTSLLVKLYRSRERLCLRSAQYATGVDDSPCPAQTTLPSYRFSRHSCPPRDVRSSVTQCRTVLWSKRARSASLFPLPPLTFAKAPSTLCSTTYIDLRWTYRQPVFFSILSTQTQLASLKYARRRSRTPQQRPRVPVRLAQGVAASGSRVLRETVLFVTVLQCQVQP